MHPRAACLAVAMVLAANIAAAQTYPYPIPSSLSLTVREVAGVARTGEIVRSGVPLPRALNVRDVSTLTLVDSAGTPVAADFSVLARWDAGRTVTSAPIQWLLVTFAATVGANGAATYRLVTDGSAGANPTPATVVTVTQTGSQFTVNTGAATFRLGSNASALFDEVRLADGRVVISGGQMSARANATNTTHASTRRVSIEHAGRLSAVIVVEGAYDLASVGATRAGGLGTRRRYVFTAGSPTAIVRQAVAWEGAHCGLGTLVCGPGPNGIQVERVRDELTLALGSSVSFAVAGSRTTAPVRGPLGASGSAYVRQRLRATRTAAVAFDAAYPGGTLSGTKADGALLAAESSSGAVVVALDHMHRYEPQALRLLNPTTLAIDIADDRIWLATRQALFATMAVSAMSATGTDEQLARLVWAPLNHPLRAWPSPQWFASSDAVDEFPVGTLPSELAGYDTLIQSVLNRTVEQTDAIGVTGLMTYGLFPRNWGTPLYSDEVDCAPGGDPTPNDTSDNLFWCTTWTDYHSTAWTAPVWAMRTGQVQWIDEIAVPAALRMLHTQILQCAPDDTYRLCFQAPAGYGAYRADFNASHQYWENLFLYYWLTGDYTAVEFIGRGGEDQRRFICQRRPASACQPDDPPPDPYALPSGRVGIQWQSTFRFLGLAGADATYLDDYKANLARAVTQFYVEPLAANTRYGFWTFDRVTGPGTTFTDQLWMTQLYDFNLLFRLQRDSNDAAIGNPAIPPSRVLESLARAMATYAPSVPGECTPRGTWPNGLSFTWSGTRIGGALASVTAAEGGSDPCLYESGLATVAALLVRVGDRGHSAIRELGRQLTRRAIASAQNELSPLGKTQGIFLSRLHAAVGRLTPIASTTCSYTVAPLSAQVPASGGSGTIDVTTTGGCAWTAAGDAAWVTLNAAGGTGSGSVTWTAAANASTTVRMATLTVAGQTISMTQAAASALTAPTNLTAQIDGTRVTLTWTAASGGGVAGYVVEAGSAPGASDLAIVATGSTMPRFVAAAVPAGTYFVRVRAAQTGAPLSDASNEIRLVLGPPGAPRGLLAAGSGSTVTLSWTAPADGLAPSGYVIFAGSASGLADLARVAVGSTTSFTAQQVPFRTYFVRVAAQNAYGIGPPSEELEIVAGGSPCIGPPGPPRGLRATVTGSRVDLSWVPPSGINSVSGYRIEAGLAPGSTVVAIDRGFENTFSTAAANGTYYVRIRARNACGIGPPSAEVVVTVPQ